MANLEMTPDQGLKYVNGTICFKSAVKKVIQCDPALNTVLKVKLLHICKN